LHYRINSEHNSQVIVWVSEQVNGQTEEAVAELRPARTPYSLKDVKSKEMKLCDWPLICGVSLWTIVVMCIIFN